MSTGWPAEERLRAIDWSPLAAVRAPVIEALEPVLAGAEAARALTRLLRQQPTWTAPQRAAAAEALLGVALWRRRLRHHAPDDSPDALLTALVRDLGGRMSAPPPDDWPTRLSYPDWLAAELTRALGPDAEPFAAASNLPGPITVRANRLRLTRDILAVRLATEGVEASPTPHAPDGLFLHGRPNVLGLPSHQSGLFEVQDEASQLVAVCVDARPGDTVLDLCAGSGGKTLALGAAMADQGTLHATDVDLAALERLEQRAARAGIRRSLRILRVLPPELRATHVLVDASCSALGTLRRGPDVRWRIDPATLDAHPLLQQQLLATAARHTAPGGRLVYATCTMRPEENQYVVRDFLGAHPDFGRIPAPVPEAVRSPDGELVTLPNRHGTDGFYAAVLERSA